MKLELLVPQVPGMTEFEWRTRQVKRLELALAQSPDKATTRALCQQLSRLRIKVRDCAPPSPANSTSTNPSGLTA